MKSLDLRIVKRVKKALLDLKTYSLPVDEYDIKKISGRQRTYRLRISKYRIIYSIDWKNSKIIVFKIEKKGRRDVSQID